ncbi:hypothetical protein BHM03_00022023 [Ensete ventricosum]|nr:hypothetical protein BHM03_00022023 [Ensete ventricosum]
MYYPMGSRTTTVSRKNVTVINFAQSHAQSRVTIDFSCTVSEFQNIGQSQHISPWEVLRAWFHEKRDGHKLYVMSRRVEFRSIFRASSQNFKILTIPNVLAHGKSYDHGFAKKCDGHKFCAKSCRVEYGSIFRAPF